MSMQKNTNIAVMLALVVVVLFVALGFFGVRGLGNNSAALSGPQAILEELQATGAVSQLHTYDYSVGEGETAKVGDVIAVHYTGVLPDGTVFDSSYERGQPLVLRIAEGGALQTLDGGSLIQGWSQGMQGMKVGGRRLLAIPSELGYGPNAVGTIPPNSTLLFDVELVQIIPPSELEGANSDSQTQ